MAENLQERLYQRLREDLLAGRFQPGERLKIRDLANQWGTSPMPVRAALQRLVAEGALEGEAQRSLRVPLMTRERFLQILQVRLSSKGWRPKAPAAGWTSRHWKDSKVVCGEWRTPCADARYRPTWKPTANST